MGGVRGVTRRDAAARRSGGERRRTLVGSLGFFTAMGRLLNRPRYTALAGPSWMRRSSFANADLGTASGTSLDAQHARKQADVSAVVMIQERTRRRESNPRGGVRTCCRRPRGGAGVRLAILDARLGAPGGGALFRRKMISMALERGRRFQPQSPSHREVGGTRGGHHSARPADVAASDASRALPHRPVSFSRSERSPSSSRARFPPPVDLHTLPRVPRISSVRSHHARSRRWRQRLLRHPRALPRGVGVGDQEGVPQARHEVAPRQEPGQQGVRREEVQVCERGVRGAVRSQEEGAVRSVRRGRSEGRIRRRRRRIPRI